MSLTYTLIPPNTTTSLADTEADSPLTLIVAVAVVVPVFTPVTSTGMSVPLTVTVIASPAVNV